MDLKEAVEKIAIWACTSGLVIILAWAFSVAADIRSLSGVGARVAELEARVNALEQRVTRNEANVEHHRLELNRHGR